MPPPWEWPDGCHFAPRCPYATEACRTGTIELRPSGLSEVRCIRADELELVGVTAWPGSIPPRRVEPMPGDRGSAEGGVAT